MGWPVTTTLFAGKAAAVSGNDTATGGDDDQVLLALSQASNAVDIVEGADALLTFTNNDANDPVDNAIRFDA